MLKAPKWSINLIHKRTKLKAARMTALYLYRNQLTGITKTNIAKALGVSRWTLDKDLASLSRIGFHIETLEKQLGELLEQERSLLP
jgi:biotin operon repressor